MNITKAKIDAIPTKRFDDISTLREALHNRWSGVTFSDATLKQMIQDRRNQFI